MAITLKFTGVVSVVEELETGTGRQSGKDWSSQAVIVEAGTEQYPNPLKVTFWNGDTKETMALRVGDEVSVEAYVRGREWNGNYSVKLNGKSLVVTKAAPEPEDGGEDEAPVEDEGDPDDLPF